MASSAPTNLERVTVAWGVDAPEWIRILASACDKTSQRAVSIQLDKSSGYVSRLISRTYAGSYDEARQQVTAILTPAEVVCPVFGLSIKLQFCIENRRRKGPVDDFVKRQWAENCPTCPNNTDTQED